MSANYEYCIEQKLKCLLIVGEKVGDGALNAFDMSHNTSHFCMIVFGHVVGWHINARIGGRHKLSISRLQSN